MKRPPCPLCRGESSRLLQRAEPPHRVWHCPGCDLAYVAPVPDPEGLSRRYDADYYAPWLSRQKRRRDLMWAERLRFVEGLVPRGRLLDVGCGDGSFLEQALRRGWAVAGTEVSAWAAGHAGARLGEAVFRGELREAGFPA